MTDILVDTSVLLDVLTNDPAWATWSAEAIASADGRFCINQIVGAELAPGFRSIVDFNGRLPAETFHREELPFDAAFLAGRAFAAYRRRGGPRTSPIADFYIGAHAVVAGYRLLTRDSAMACTYFPHLSLIAPK
jgi:predicted nucleic acid-binding protein